MTVPLLKPAPDFGQPLDLLSACHQRIQGQCGTMLKLVGHCRLHGSDREAQTAAAAVLKYFATAAVHHHEDEEHSLFPMLQGLLEEPLAGRVAVLTSNLERQHRDLEQAWSAVRPWLEAIAAGEAMQADEAAVGGLVQLYERHIELEESQLLPLCRKVLSTLQLEALGQAMAHRRGVSWAAA